jgi:hypothetical protein
MRIEEAQRLVQKEYENSKNLEFVRDPVAYSLYKVWKLADADKKSGRRSHKRKVNNMSMPLEMCRYCDTREDCYCCDDLEKWIREQKETVKHEWISVKDRLPEVGQNVLVCDVGPDSDYGIRVLSLECDEKGTYWDDGDGWWFEPEDMSHWMPLPEPPEMNNEEEQA